MNRLNNATSDQMGDLAAEMQDVDCKTFARYILESTRNLSDLNLRKNLGYLLFYQNSDGQHIYLNKLADAKSDIVNTVAASIVSEALSGKYGEYFNLDNTSELAMFVQARLDSGDLHYCEANTYYMGCSGCRDLGFTNLCAQMGKEFNLTGVSYTMADMAETMQ